MFEGGTLEHLPRVLLAVQRPERDARQRQLPPAEHLSHVAHAVGERTTARIYRLIGKQLRRLSGCLSSWAHDLSGGGSARPPGVVSDARLAQIVREYRLLRREGTVAQFAVHVQNLESLYDIILGVSKIASTYVVRPRCPASACANPCAQPEFVPTLCPACAPTPLPSLCACQPLCPACACQPLCPACACSLCVSSRQCPRITAPEQGSAVHPLRCALQDLGLKVKDRASMPEFIALGHTVDAALLAYLVRSCLPHVGDFEFSVTDRRFRVFRDGLGLL